MMKMDFAEVPTKSSIDPVLKWSSLLFRELAVISIGPKKALSSRYQCTPYSSLCLT